MFYISLKIANFAIFEEPNRPEVPFLRVYILREKSPNISVSAFISLKVYIYLA